MAHLLRLLVLLLCVAAAAARIRSATHASRSSVEEAKALRAVLAKAPLASPDYGFILSLFAARKGGAATLFLPMAGLRLGYDRLRYNDAQFNSILKFHLIKDQKYTIADLRGLPEDTLIPTAAGSSLKVFSKKGASQVLLQGKTFVPAAVVVPNIFVGKKLVIHGISQRLIPPTW